MKLETYSWNSSLSVTVVVLTILSSLVLSNVSGLSCFVCVEVTDDEPCSKDKLEGDKDKFSFNCSSVFDRCMRTEAEVLGVKSVVTRCATQEECTTQKTACDDVSTCKDVVCCDTDNCNAGSAFFFSVSLVAMCYTLGLVLLN